MKTISLLLSSVLFCTLVSAHGTDDAARASSSVAITRATGSSLVKLYYKSTNRGSVKVSISDEMGHSVFPETLKKVVGFMRAYNFDGLPDGQYTVRVEDESGQSVEKITYKSGKAEQLIHLQKLASEENKYLLTMATPKPKEIDISIYDINGSLLHTEHHSLHGEFAQVYNLKSTKSFTMEVKDKDGVIKSVTY